MCLITSHHRARDGGWMDGWQVPPGTCAIGLGFFGLGGPRGGTRVWRGWVLDDLLSLLPEVGACCYFGSGLVLFTSCRWWDFYGFLGLPVPCAWFAQPCFHFPFFPGPAGVHAFSLLLSLLCSRAFLCFPLPFFFSFSFNFCFPFFFSLSGWVVLVVPCGWYFGFSAALSCVGASTRPVFFVLFCCMISLCLGFGSPRVFCPVLLPRRSWCHAGRKVGILLAAGI